METATFAGGCFWCTEAVFKRLKGVESVTSGYAGKEEKAPSYEEVASGSTDFAEAIQIQFDPAAISYETLLEVFWATHDPTTLNRQGADTGPQYRSVVFYHDDNQKQAAEKSLRALDASKQYEHPAVTAIEPLEKFFPAEDYHQDFYDNNPSYGYCRVVIDPKITKLYEKFKQLA